MSARLPLPPPHLALLGALSLLPLLSLIGAPPESVIADPASELPVKIWCAEFFFHGPLLGGVVEGIGWPQAGPLNNPDPAGMLWMGLWTPLVGRAWAWNLMIPLQLWLTAVTAAMLAREALDPDRRDPRAAQAALVAGAAAASTPMLLVYAVAGAVSDMLNLWPYPLCVLWLLRALRALDRGRDLQQERAALRAVGISGVFAGLGFITCPYNVLIFIGLLPPALLTLPLIRARLAEGRWGWRGLARLVAAGALATGLVAGGYGLWLRAIMADDQSQMSAEDVDYTRHSAPYPFLRPAHSNRYVSWLSDYVAVGKDRLIVREAGSRYYRACSTGFLLLGLALLGIYARDGQGRRSTAALIWAVCALSLAVASTGPFMPWDAQRFSRAVVNLPWWITHHLTGRLLLEPFRFAVVAALALGVAAAFGARALIGRRSWLGWLLPVAVVAEVAILSPVPAPLPVMSVRVPEVYSRLDALLPPGAILELPYFYKSSDVFQRVHFLYQRTHRRPIPDEVMGFVPRSLTGNAWTATLLAIENNLGQLRVELGDESRYDSDRAALKAAGLVGVVVDPAAYADGVWERVRRRLDRECVRVEEGERWVYRL